MSTVSLRHRVDCVAKPSTEPLPTIQLESVASGTATLVGSLPVEEPAGNNKFQPGDVLFAKLRPYLSKSYLVGSTMQGSPEFLCLRPGPRIAPPYLQYLTLSRSWLDYADLTSYGTKMPRTSWDQMADLQIPDLALSEQRRIADFLDDRVGRIDQIITVRRQQMASVDEASSSVFGEALRSRGLQGEGSVDEGWRHTPNGWRQTTLGRVLRQLTNGFVGPTRDILTDDGVRYIQSTHIKAGRIDFPRRPFYVSQEWHDARPRISLQPNDILIVQTGDIGQVALVPAGFGPASCHALLIARVDPALVSARYLLEHLRSGFGRAAMMARATGALHPHLEAGVRTCPVVLPPGPVQAEITEQVAGTRAANDSNRAALARTITLLANVPLSGRPFRAENGRVAVW